VASKDYCSAVDMVLILGLARGKAPTVLLKEDGSSAEISLPYLFGTCGGAFTGWLF
jgi:hypothetical protein